MWPFDNPQTENEASFGQGRSDRESASTGDEITHGILDAVRTVMPSCEKHDCYEAGWHEKDNK